MRSHPVDLLTALEGRGFRPKFFDRVSQNPRQARVEFSRHLDAGRKIPNTDV
ncbi:hypothetical protein CKA32_005116 [Geitlerinema sp. FC II]|nr:hypothetical protein CKA32_005116 [Geitlerinema sp. FC II]